MDEQTTNASTPSLDLHKPDAGTLPKDANDYIEFLEGEVKRLKGELDANRQGEALGVAWGQLWGIVRDAETDVKHLVFINNLTGRSYVGAEEAFNGLIAAMQKIKGKFKFAPYPVTDPDVPESAQRFVQNQSQGNGNGASKPAPTKAPAGNGDANPGDNGTSIFRADYIVIEPEEDDAEGNERASIQFWGNNRRYADLFIKNWKVDSLVEMFGQAGGREWDAVDFFKKKTITVPLQVGWVNSTKTNTQGKPYKDVVSVG